MTPYKGDVSRSQSQYNYQHSRARIVIEQSFGLLKTRFRTIFMRSLELKISSCCEVIAACVVLHNICVSMGDILDEQIMNDATNDVGDVENNHEAETENVEALRFRDELCREIENY